MWASCSPDSALSAAEERLELQLFPNLLPKRLDALGIGGLARIERILMAEHPNGNSPRRLALERAHHTVELQARTHIGHGALAGGHPVVHVKVAAVLAEDRVRDSVALRMGVCPGRCLFAGGSLLMSAP